MHDIHCHNKLSLYEYVKYCYIGYYSTSDVQANAYLFSEKIYKQFPSMCMFHSQTSKFI
jgi:hypothetical protein